MVLLISITEQLVRRRWPGHRSWTPPRGWTHLEDGSLAEAACRRHAIEPAVNRNHVIDRFSAVPVICLPTETVKALVIVTIGVDNKDSAHVIVAAIGSRAVTGRGYGRAPEKQAVHISQRPFGTAPSPSVVPNE